MVNWILTTAILLAAVAATAVAQQQQQQQQATTPPQALTFPVQGLIDLDEGTIEFWIALAFDPTEAHENYRGRGQIMNIGFGDPAFPDDSWNLSLGTQPTQQSIGSAPIMRCSIRAGVVVDGQELPHPMLTPITHEALPKRGEWTHFAVSWSGRTVRAYSNGKLLFEHEYRDPPQRPLHPAGAISIGASPQFKYDRRGQFAIDDLRVSSVARAPSELGFHHATPQPDAKTLLLITFDEPAAAGAIQPTVAAITDAQAPRSLPEPFRLVPGRHGQALSLTDQPLVETP